MLAKEMRTKSEAELRGRLEELRSKVARLTMARNASRLDKPSELRSARREVARLLTILGEQQHPATQEAVS